MQGVVWRCRVANPTSATDAVLPYLALRPRQAAAAIGISERKLWEITADQTSGIPVIKFGKCVTYPVRELQDWLAQQAKGTTR